MKSFHKMSESELSEMKSLIAKQAFLDGAKFALSGDNHKLSAVIRLVAEDYADQVKCNEIDLLNMKFMFEKQTYSDVNKFAAKFEKLKTIDITDLQ